MDDLEDGEDIRVTAFQGWLSEHFACRRRWQSIFMDGHSVSCGDLPTALPFDHCFNPGVPFSLANPNTALITLKPKIDQTPGSRPSSSLTAVTPFHSSSPTPHSFYRDQLPNLVSPSGP